MPTLRAIFRLTDNYSAAIARITRSTDSASSSIGKASSATDNFNNRLATSHGFVTRLTSGIGGLVKAYLSLKGVQEAMLITDNYVNTGARLSLITNSLQQQRQLQNEIFAAASQSRGAYTDMASAVAKLGITAGSYFKNTGQIVQFVKTMQESFKIAGTSTADQAAAMLQITQAIGSGKLQGDEFRSIMENAPMAAQAIAKYLGKSVGQLKQMSTDGKLTSDVIINGVLSATSTLDAQVKKMPTTFGDVWNRIKNGATQAFGGVFSSVSSSLNSKGFNTFVNGMVGSFTVLAQAANKVLGVVGAVAQFIADNWSMIAPIIGGITTALIIYKGVAVATAIVTGILAFAEGARAAALAMEAGATFAATAAQYGLNAALYACPITWIVLAIIALIVIFYAAVAAVNHFAGTSVSATGLIGAYFGILAANVYNNIAYLWNTFAIFANFIGNLFQNPVAAIQLLFYNMAANILGYIRTIAQGIQDLLNSIPGISVDITSSVDGMQNAIQAKVTQVRRRSKLKDIAPTMQYVQYKDAARMGYNKGSSLEKSVTGLFSGKSNLGKLPSSASNLGTKANPATVKGTGAGGNVQVNIADQDLQYLRDLAEKSYVNKFSTAVLSPKLTVNFSGNAGDKTSMKQIYAEIANMMNEQLAVAADGRYDA